MDTRMIVGLLVGLGLLTGCTEVADSQNIRTQGIAALITATAETDHETVVRATLKVGGPKSNTLVNLGGGDRIFMQSGDKRVEMQSQSAGVYLAKLNTAAAETEIIVDFQREQDDDAPASRGALPAPFTISLAASTASRAEDLTISWDPAGSNDDMRLELNGSCIFRHTVDVPGDSGSHVIPANTLKPTGATDAPPPTCDLTVSMSRIRKGTPDSAFDIDSSFTLTQTRTSKFTSTP
jgi:hypothetical protein